MSNGSLAVRAGLIWLALLCVACSQNSGLPDFSDLVEQNSPSVVNISAVSHEPAEHGATYEEDTPEWFKRFLDEHPSPEGSSPAEPPPESQPLGSGFVLWEDGHVLTNYHVIRGATEVIVRLQDRRELTAKVVGVDEATDLALLWIDAKGLDAVEIGDSHRLRPGQWVFAIGSPFSFDYSVTAGIVSAKGRSLHTEQYVPFIQTDVAINPGNSGGPLFNLGGKVVGVNSQIYSQSGSYQGVSFAIPIDVALRVAQQLRDHGRVTRGWLGVVVQEVDRELARSFGLDRPHGALISKVMEGSPAEETGLQAGDVILSFNGSELPESGSLPPLVGSVDPGQVVSLKIVRDGKPIDFKVEMGELAQETVTAKTPTVEPRPAVEGVLGLVVSSLSEEERQQLRVISGGVRVTRVLRGPARDAGVQPGDVVLTLAGQEVDSPERFAEVAGRLTPGTTVPMLVSRTGAPSFLPLEVPQ